MLEAIGRVVNSAAEFLSDHFKEKLFDTVARAGVIFFSVLGPWLLPADQSSNWFSKTLTKSFANGPEPARQTATAVSNAFAMALPKAFYFAATAVFLYRCIVAFRAPAVPVEDIVHLRARSRTILALSFMVLVGIFIGAIGLDTALLTPLGLLIVFSMMALLFLSYLASVVPFHFALIPPHVRVAMAPPGCRTCMRWLTRLTLALGVRR